MMARRIIVNTLCAFLAGALVLVSCGKPVLRLGLSVTLTGRNSEPGISERNGALIALDDLRAAGRKVELEIKDDGGSPEAARKADASLFDKGIGVIIGHVTSSITKEALPQADEKGYLLFSPSANSTDLAGKDDNFIMFIPTARAEAGALAEWAIAKGLRKAGAIYDLSNATFSANFTDAFRDAFQAGGGRFKTSATFTSSPDADLSKAIAPVLASAPDCVVIVAGVLDASLIAQRLRAAGFSGTLISSDWALAPELVTNGGQAAQGMVFAYIYDESNPSSRLKDFEAKYLAKYGAPAGDAAKLAWETIMVLSEAVRGGESPSAVKKTLLAGSFQGLQDTIRFDASGDVVRPLRILELRNEEFLPAK